MTFDNFTASDVLDAVEGRWSLASNIEATKVHHGYRQVTVVHMGHLDLPELGWLVEPFAPVWSAWLSWLDVGGYILPHVDAGPYRERWQVPVTRCGVFTDNAGSFGPTVGEPFRVHQYLPHSVTSPGPLPRVSAVIDRDVLLDVPNAPFRLEVTDGSR